MSSPLHDPTDVLVLAMLTLRARVVCRLEHSQHSTLCRSEKTPAVESGYNPLHRKLLGFALCSFLHLQPRNLRAHERPTLKRFAQHLSAGLWGRTQFSTAGRRFWVVCFQLLPFVPFSAAAQNSQLRPCPAQTGPNVSSAGEVRFSGAAC